MKRSLVIVGMALVTALAYYGCGGSSSSSSNMASSAISSPLVSSASLSAVSKPGRVFAATYDDRVTVLNTLLTTSDKEACKFTIDLTPGSGRADCYGPEVQLGGNHPNDSNNPTSQDLPTGDTGMMNSSQAGEACSAAELTTLMDFHTKYAYFAQLTGAALRCFANNASITLPTA